MIPPTLLIQSSALVCSPSTWRLGHTFALAFLICYSCASLDRDTWAGLHSEFTVAASQNGHFIQVRRLPCGHGCALSSLCLTYCTVARH